MPQSITPAPDDVVGVTSPRENESESDLVVGLVLAASTRQIGCADRVCHGKVARLIPPVLDLTTGSVTPGTKVLTCE